MFLSFNGSFSPISFDSNSRFLKAKGPAKAIRMLVIIFFSESARKEKDADSSLICYSEPVLIKNSMSQSESGSLIFEII